MVMVPGRAGSWQVLWVLALFSSGLVTPEGMKLPAKQFSKSSETSPHRPSNSPPAPRHRITNSFSTESPTNSSLSQQANVTPKPENYPSAHTPLSEAVNYTSVERLNSSFTPTEHPRRKLIPTELPREKSISTELTRGESISTELTRGESIPTKLPRGESIPTKLPRGESIPTELLQRKLIPSQLLQGKSVRTDHLQGQSIPTELPRGQSIPTDRLRGVLTTTDSPPEKLIRPSRLQSKSILIEFPQGTPIAKAHPRGNLSSKERLISISSDPRNDTHRYNFRTDHPIPRQSPIVVTISTHSPPKEVQAETTAKFRRPTVQDQLNGSLALLNVFEFAADSADAGQLMTNPTEKHAPKLPSFLRAENDDGEEKAKMRTVRETFEEDPLYENSENNEFTDNIMVPSEVNERFEKWHPVNDVHGNTIGLNSDDQISPAHQQKTIYARKLEYSLPSTYAVMVKKVYSSKQGLNSFSDNETPKQTIEMPWFLKEHESGNAQKIIPKESSPENENESVAEESNQNLQKVTKSSSGKNSQTTQHPFFDTHSKNEFTLSDYEGLPSDWMLDNEIDSSWGQKGIDELQKEPIQVNYAGSKPQRKNYVQVGDNKLHGNDHLHNSTSPTLKQDSSMQRRHRNAESLFTRAPTVQLLQNSGDWKFLNSIPLQSTSSDKMQSKEFHPSLNAESFISTDMLTDSSLQDIRVKMRKQLKIDNTKPKLNSIYNNEAGKPSVQNEEEPNDTVRNPFFVSKQAGFREEKLQDFIRHETKNEPPPTSNEELETLKPKHGRFFENNGRKHSLNKDEKISESEFTTFNKKITGSKPSREISSYSSVPQIENSEENNIVGGDNERKENIAPRAEQSVRNDDINRRKYLNSRPKDREDESGPPQGRKVPIVKYFKRVQASERENLSYERPHRENVPRDHARGSAASNHSKKRNYGNELAKKINYGSELAKKRNYGNELAKKRNSGNELAKKRNDGNELAKKRNYGNEFNKGTAADRTEPHGEKAFGRRGESIRRIDYDEDYVDYPQESRDSPKSNDDDGSKHYEDHDLSPIYDSNYQTESEDYPVVHDDYIDGPHESKRKYPNDKATDSSHDDRRSTTKEHAEPQQTSDDRHAPHNDRRDENHQHNPHNHHNYNTAEKHAPKPQKQSPQPKNDETSRDPPTLFDHAMQVAAATGKKLISPLLYLPDTQNFPVFERFGNFAKFKQ